LGELMKTTYDMFISYFQLIFISSLRWLMETTYIFYKNSLTLFYLVFKKYLTHKWSYNKRL